jgi:SAM-dependent methyltransferase
VPYTLDVRDACPACTGSRWSVLVDLPYDSPQITDALEVQFGDRFHSSEVGGNYTLVECATCGLIFQLGIPDAELLTRIYDAEELHDPEAHLLHRGFAERRGYAFQVEEMLKYFGRQPADVEVLDYGMGPGNWLLMARAYGCRVSGAELSDGHVEAAIPGAAVVPYDDLPAGRYDFVNTEQVFEHLTEPAETGARLVAALRPGGVLRISVPNAGNLRDLLADPDWRAPKGTARSLNAAVPIEHVNCFTHDSLMRFATTRLRLEPMTYPTRQYLEPWGRMRFAVSAVVHTVRRPKGTMQLFRKP